MSTARTVVATFAALAALSAPPAALASGGGPGGGGGGAAGGGGGAVASGGGGGCAPLTMPLALVHPRTTYSLNLSATIKNCSKEAESWSFAVYFEEDPTPIYSISTGGAIQRAGDSLTIQIGSFGGTPGVPETFTGVLTKIGASPGVISTVTSTNTIPTTPLTP